MEAKKHPALGLVVIDMPAQVATPLKDVTQEHSYTLNVDELTESTRFASSLDIAILFTDHNNKRGMTDYVDAVMSSAGKPGAAALIWSLKRDRGSPNAILYGTGWDCEDFELPLVFQKGGGFRLLEGTVRENVMSAERRSILDELQKAPSGLDAKTQAKALGKHEKTPRWHLGEMLKGGLVRQPKRGRYLAVRKVKGSNKASKQSNKHASTSNHSRKPHDRE